MEDQSFSITRPGSRDIDTILEMIDTSFQDEFRITGVDLRRVRTLARFMVSPVGRLLLYLYRVGSKTEVLPYAGKVGHKPVAFTMMTLQREYGYISSVVVHPEFRRHGYAKMLFSRMIEDAEGKTKRLVLHVSASNLPAKNLYTSLGFRKFETSQILICDDLAALISGLQEDISPVRPQRISDRNDVFELLKGSYSPMHQETIPLRRQDIFSGHIPGRVKTFVYQKAGRIEGTITCSVPKPPMPVRLHKIGVHPALDSVMRSSILRALLQASIKWASRHNPKRCILTIEDWSGTEDLIKDLRMVGFRDGLTMEGMRRDYTRS